jgi:GT2 family glycosyltransferase
MRVTVVVPTHNRASFLSRTIVSLTEQELPPTDIVVVDNASTDDTAAVVADLKTKVKRLRYVLEPRLGVSCARNRGAAEASGHLVAFLDDDAVAAPQWIEAFVEAAEAAPEAAAFAGPIDLRWTRPRPPWLRGLEGWYGRFDLGSERRRIESPLYPFASNLAFRREAFLTACGFPVELGPRGTVRIANEEDGLFRRVAQRGWTVLYEPDALVYHWVHKERLTRSYLIGRSYTQGRSEVLVDALFTARRRSERARRSARALVDAARAARAASEAGDPTARMRGLVAAGTSIGTAVREAGLALGPARHSPRPGNAPGSVGLSPEQRDRFERDGFVKVVGAFDATGMEERMWEFFARRGVDRHDRATWPLGDARHLQKLLREAVFMPIGGRRTSTAIDDLLGPGRWLRPEHWGELLVTFPERPGRRWTIPTLWHTDAAYTEPLHPLSGVMVFTFLNRVGHRGGGTLVLAGSHRLIARFVSGRPGVQQEKAAVIRRSFYASHPWLTALVEDTDAHGRYERFSQEIDIDGIGIRLVELTGDPGDIVITHPLIAHSFSLNCGSEPRFMRIIRPRVRLS